jgi:hypothetical protein
MLMLIGGTMNFGIPSDLTCYKLFTDLGSLIAGVLALIAGVAAYVAGDRQARATTEAAKNQIDAINQQQKAEILNVRESVRIEITTFTKYIIGKPF